MHAATNQELSNKVDSQKETIADLENEVTDLREQIAQRPSHPLHSGRASPLSVELDFADTESVQEAVTKVCVPRPSCAHMTVPSLLPTETL